MREEKPYLTEEIKFHIGKSTGFVLISYERLNANKVSAFRREVRKLKGGVEIVKKRLLCKACQELGLNLDLAALPGHIGMIFATADMLEMIKYAFQFRSENEELVKVVGGNFEGKLLTANEAEMLSKLPGKDQMRAELLSVFEAPLAGTLATMEALISSVVYCLENKAKQEQA
jgi:large subunit ribosomal protein L10